MMPHGEFTYLFSARWQSSAICSPDKDTPLCASKAMAVATSMAADELRPEASGTLLVNSTWKGGGTMPSVCNSRRTPTG